MNRSMSDTSCKLLGDFFATLGNTTRMRIFCALQRKPRTVTEIAGKAGVSIANASQHLRLMRDRGTVIAEKYAQNVYYRIADPQFVEASIVIEKALLKRLRHDAGQAPARRTRQKQHRVLQAALSKARPGINIVS